MVLLISPQQIELESCACAQIKALEKENCWLYPDDAGFLSERGKNAANLISDGGGLSALFSRVNATLYSTVSVHRSVGWSVGNPFTPFLAAPPPLRFLFGGNKRLRPHRREIISSSLSLFL